MNNAFLTGQGADGADGHLVPAVRHRRQPDRRAGRRRRPADTPKITIVPIPFPDVAGKGNPSTMFADPDAGHAVNAKSKNRNAAITFALWMGGTKEGQQVVVNNMDSFATLNGVTPQFDKITLVNPTVQQPELEKVTKSLGAAKRPRSLRHVRPAEPGHHRRQPGVVNSDKSAADVAADIQSRGRRQVRQPTNHGHATMSARTTDDHHDNQRRAPSAATARRSPRRSSRLHRAARPALDPAGHDLLGRAALLLHLLHRLHLHARLGRRGPAPGERRVGQLRPDGSRTRCSGGRSATPSMFFVATFVVQVALGIVFACLLHSKLYLKTLYKVLIFIPVVLATATVAPVFRQIYAPDGT